MKADEKIDGKIKRGGKRPGSGRKRGTPNKRSQAAIAAASATGLLPHEFLLNIMRGNEKMLGRKPTDEERIDCAAKAAPYFAPRLSAVAMKVKEVGNPWVEILELVRANASRPLPKPISAFPKPVR